METHQWHMQILTIYHLFVGNIMTNTIMQHTQHITFDGHSRSQKSLPQNSEYWWACIHNITQNCTMCRFWLHFGYLLMIAWPVLSCNAFNKPHLMNMTPQFLMHFISTNILMVLANFLGIIIQPFSKTISHNHGNTILDISDLVYCSLIGTSCCSNGLSDDHGVDGMFGWPQILLDCLCSGWISQCFLTLTGCEQNSIHCSLARHLYFLQVWSIFNKHWLPTHHARPVSPSTGWLGTLFPPNVYC